MKKTFGLLMTIALAVLALPAVCAPIFVDGFEPQVRGDYWPLGPWPGTYFHEKIFSDSSHIRTPGVTAARVERNYNVTYNSQHSFLPDTYNDNVYVKVWMFEDNDISYGGFYSEYQPNCHLTLMDTTTVNDFFRVGVMGQYVRDLKSPAYFYNCAIETSVDGPKPLDGQLGRPLVPRRQGWRKYTILVKPYTGNAGDVQFFIDDKLVFNGKRAANPMVPGTGAPVDNVVLGNKWWTHQFYWMDQFDSGSVENAVDCTTIADAKEQPDGTWVTLTQKVVSGNFSKAPFPGYFAIEETDRAGGLWVSSSYTANVAAVTNEAEKVTVKGIMYTNGAGVRYLDAIQVTREQDYATQAKVVGCSLKSLDDPAINGTLVNVWGKVTAKGQERQGDWRRYILIDDGSDNAPIKCYYDNIISGINPVPNVNTNDFVSVVGVAGRDALTIGGPAESSVWIRKAGDLRVLRAAQ